jgi:dihydrofolate synthase/folylpolyglutamate synthase
MLQHMNEDLRPELETLRAGVAAVEHHGRNQIEVIDGRVWLFVVAHNVAGMDSLVDTIDILDLPRPLIALVAVLGDKDWRSMLSSLFSRIDEAFLTQAPSAPLDRCWKPEDAFEALEKIVQLRIEEDFEEALIQARSDAGQGTVLVTGSVHTVGSALKILGRGPFRGESC